MFCKPEHFFRFSKGWDVSLVQELDERLLEAIITAIWCHQELGLI